MINFLSDWAKNIGLAVVITSILEMILPNNKTKKYIKMVMGTYIIFCIISPFLKKEININDFKMEEYAQNTSSIEINQESMNKRINEMYIEELEKNIKKKVEEQGYVVNECNVDATIADNVQNTKINKITLDVEVGENKEQKDEVEDKLLVEIQKIKKINTNDKTEKKENELTETQKKDLKKFLKEEYEVNEKCLVIT